MTRRACIACLCLMVAPLPGAAQPGDRVEVPIKAVVLPDGVRRYSISVTIDGQPVEAQLDTGSTGLRILKSGVAGPAAATRGQAIHYSYGSGVELSGERVTAAVGIGGGAASMPIERVDTVGCTERVPDCPGKRLSAADYRIGGDGQPGRGFVAIVGTGLHADAVPNPLVALGIRRWIVDLPRAGEATGRLVVNPTADEVARYREFAVIGESNQLPACLVRTGTGQKLCGPAMVDSGASGLRIQGGKPTDIWPNGTAAVIALGDGGGIASFPVSIGRRDQASGMFAMPRRAGSETMTLNLGLAPFFHWSVLFDAGARRIGVADR